MAFHLGFVCGSALLGVGQPVSSRTKAFTTQNSLKSDFSGVNVKATAPKTAQTTSFEVNARWARENDWGEPVRSRAAEDYAERRREIIERRQTMDNNYRRQTQRNNVEDYDKPVTYRYGHPQSIGGVWREGPGLGMMSRCDNPAAQRNYNEDWWYEAEVQHFEEPESNDGRPWFHDVRAGVARPRSVLHEAGPMRAGPIDNILEGLREREDVKMGRSNVDLYDYQAADFDDGMRAPKNKKWWSRHAHYMTEVQHPDHILEGMAEREAYKRGQSEVDISDYDNHDLGEYDSLPVPEYIDHSRRSYAAPARYALRASSIDNIMEGLKERERSKVHNR
mmetsp:Transcript_32728/g.53085  ORF Transcript_32728/g.53085 Transcript_32728/m.53085 type:complete len:335 (-) Transcript_32728:323-1327(-)|eukprot:CAMPEP_0184657494 /NCGR_PEP_ID=MMETSP0308-20130426/20122_1 /TAXON_ID=38269 /ORGANISM="Gloeochaete witrockiana, Strain SAG 46.84" /LENGTH=334 /DNA_ID=CAMNT_0027095403 /DNA_START=138 /DNA_END=1142 /DNA_ORIENTATION=+